MKHIVRASALWLVLALCSAAYAQRQDVTEHDFLADMPVVLSVSRLAQRLDDTPGAVTILDRELIRRSGARDLVDVLRLVPGFQTTGSFETDATLASYHGRTDDWSNRIQVLVDGRSVYASHLQGSTGLGLHTLALDEIERVEVFRGSNSAAYGARAFLGVINIVSREGTEDRRGTAHAALGENSVADAGVGLYGSTERSTYRLHADSRSDAGLRGAFGASRVDRFNIGSSMNLGGGNELKLRAGALDIQAGRGSLDVDAYGNRARTRGMGSAFLQVDGRYVVDAHNDVQYSLSRTNNRFDDHFRYYGDASLPAYNGITIDFSGQETNDEARVQWTSALTDRLRLLTGLELRNELLVSPSSFDDRKQVQTSFSRAFFTTEWRPVDALVFNAGALHEYSTQSGDNVAPRLMVNWHPAAGHTLRAGYSSAFLPPSAYEKYALVIYRDRSGGGPLTFVQGNPALRPERVEVSELGYQLAWPQQALSMDLRAFDERVSDGLRSKGSPSKAYNGDDYRITGVEWQLDWRWRKNTRLFFSSTLAQIDVANSVDPEYYLYRMQYGMARNAESLALLHTFDNGLDLGLTWSHAESVTLASVSRNRWTFNLDRLDLRLAKQVRVGGQRGEWALTVQNLGGPKRDGDWKYTMLPRAFVSFRLDF